MMNLGWQHILGDLSAVEVGQAVDPMPPMALSAMNDHAGLRIRMRWAPRSLFGRSRDSNP